MRTLHVEEARFLIRNLINRNALIEIWWITGKHSADPNYRVGKWVDPSSAGEWTDHPDYSGTRHEGRQGESVAEWVLMNLPTKGMVTVTYRP
jgi:hypothetical protein